MVFFSVIIPTYNRANLITTTIDSVLGQHHDHFEVLLIDDGSTDNTRKLVTSKYKNEERLQYFYKENGERGAARNYGIQQAKGNYLVFLDSDDSMLPDHLNTLEASIISSPNIYFFATKYKLFNGASYISADIQKINEGSYDYLLLLKGNPFSCNFCVKNDPSVFKLFEEERSIAAFEDWLFLIENLFKNKILLIDKITIIMNDHKERSMREDNQKLITKRIMATQWISGKLSFSVKEKATLWAYSYYFCAVHAYLDCKKLQSLYLIGKATVCKFQKFFLLFALKALIGRKVIATLTRS